MALIPIILALIPAVLKFCCKVLIKRCSALRSETVEASPVAVLVAVVAVARAPHTRQPPLGWDCLQLAAQAASE